MLPDCTEGLKNFSKYARELIMRLQKIDNDNYPETLYRLYIINAGQGFKMLWGTIKSFLDPQTASKIHVLGCKYQNKLLEIIDESELPDFLGGKCRCEEHGGCPKSDKGPWKDPDIIKRALNGEANYGQQILAISSTDGKKICYTKPHQSTKKGSDASAESSSEVEDVLSPTAPVNPTINPDFTFVHEPTLPGHASTSDARVVEESICVYDKVVGDACSSPRATSLASTSGSFSLRNIPTTMGGLQTQITTWLTVLIMSLFMVLRSVPSRMAKRLSRQTIACDHCRVEFPQELEFKEEFGPPSPSPRYTKNDTLSSVFRRIGELEENVHVLETKPSQMPFEKEELLNATVRRVDALEAELISTNKTLYETLMRQDELLAYIDQEENIKFGPYRHITLLEAKMIEEQDIQFWNKNKSMEGLSTKYVVLNFVCQLIVFLYLLDNETSWMILASFGIGVCALNFRRSAKQCILRCFLRRWANNHHQRCYVVEHLHKHSKGLGLDPPMWAHNRMMVLSMVMLM